MPQTDVRLLRFSDRALREFGTQLLTALEVPVPQAELVSHTLVEANLRGVDSHGLQSLATMYVAELQSGGIDPRAVGEVALESGACLVYDGQSGLGQVVSDRCTDHAIRLAARTGLSLVVARNSNHFGAAAYWTHKLARAGYIGIAGCNGCAAAAPWQGKSPRLSTNPLSMAVPATEIGRWVLDMATTTVASGKLTDAAYRNQDKIPGWWGFLDGDGNPTTDRRAAEKGRPSPIGGYKGTGLAMMVEILCAGLSGGPMSTDVPVYDPARPIQVSHTFLAIDPARFMGLAEFEGRMSRLAQLVKSSEPAPGYDEVLIAGEPEWRAMAERLREGIPIPEPLWEALTSIAAPLKVVPPLPDAGGGGSPT